MWEWERETHPRKYYNWRRETIIIGIVAVREVYLLSLEQTKTGNVWFSNKSDSFKIYETIQQKIQLWNVI